MQSLIYHNSIFISLDGSGTYNKSLTFINYGIMNFDIRLYLYLDLITNYKTQIIKNQLNNFKVLWFNFKEHIV